jgi:hypothetical protein
MCWKRPERSSASPYVSFGVTSAAGDRGLETAVLRAAERHAEAVALDDVVCDVKDGYQVTDASGLAEAAACSFRCRRRACGYAGTLKVGVRGA